MTQAHLQPSAYIDIYRVCLTAPRLGVHVLQMGVPKDTLGNNLPRHQGHSGLPARQGMLASQSANLSTLYEQ